MGISPSKKTIGQCDLEVAEESKNLLKGGFHYGQARKPVVYIPPKPLLNHGPHRCTSQNMNSSYMKQRRKQPDYFL